MITKKVVGTEKSGVNVWFLAARSLLSQSIAVIMMMMTRRRMMTMITRRMTMKSMMILLMTLLLQLLLLLLIRLGSSEFSRPVFPRNQPILINSTVIADFLSKVLIVLIYFFKSTSCEKYNASSVVTEELKTNENGKLSNFC